MSKLFTVLLMTIVHHNEKQLCFVFWGFHTRSAECGVLV